MFDFDDIKDDEIGTIGFESKRDLLNRTETGRQLSDLVERIEQPMVIALDGPWGSGKSHFLKLWVGAHTLENTKVDEGIGKSRVIYFDAFKNDYLDDPLIALTSVILSKIESEKGTTTKIKTSATKKLKKAGFVVAKGVAKTMVRKFAGDALEEIGDIIASEDEEPNTSEASVEDKPSETDKGLAKTSSDAFEKATEEFWRTEKNRKQEMLFFREALESLVPTSVIKNQNVTNPTQTHKMVLVIDELDRCRPDYALSLLEIMKHFFDVPNVHFVLGVRLEALENSVKARYGDGIDAGLYLKKFINLNFSLSNKNQNRNIINSTAYWNILCHRLDNITEEQERMGRRLINDMEPKFTLSLRDIQQYICEVSIAPLNKKVFAYRAAIMTALLIKIVKRSLYEEILKTPQGSHNTELYKNISELWASSDKYVFASMAYFIDTKTFSEFSNDDKTLLNIDFIGHGRGEGASTALSVKDST